MIFSYDYKEATIARGNSMKSSVRRTRRIVNRMRNKQRGAVTMFSAVLILILLTGLVLYAYQVGVFEQRKSSNEMRYKEAFHLADSAVQLGKEYMLSNVFVIATEQDDVFMNGTEDGWLPGSSDPHWRLCSEANLSAGSGTHPCFAEVALDRDGNSLRDNMYFYMTDPDEDPNVIANLELPIDDTGLLADNTQRVATYALLCMMDVNTNNALLSPPQPIVEGCTTQASEQDQRYFLVTILARGEADCSNGNCTAQSLIADKIGSLGPGITGGGPGAPLTTKSSFPPQGNVDIVANPNGGGIGVPMSVWIDDGVYDELELDNASWATCERHEWYEMDTLPDHYKCPDGGNNCSCSNKRQLSYPVPGEEPNINIDFVIDEDFPELFQYITGFPKTAIGIDTVKGLANEVIDSCDSSLLNEDSRGLIWVEGNCDLPSGNNYTSPSPVKQIGRATSPVFLVLAGADNKFSGQFDLFGTVMLTDAESSGGVSISGAGTPTIYGAMIIDAPNDAIDKFNGTLGLVYLESVIQKSLSQGNFGTIAGAWTDFHRDWR